MARPIPTQNGTANDDLLYGDDPKGRPGAQIINGLAGNDTIYGDLDVLTKKSVGGNDQIFGGDGDDHLYGDAATLSGSAHGGADSISGGAGYDLVYGDANSMYGSSVGGADTLNGGAGDESDLYGDADALHDTSRGGDDVLVGDDQGATQMNFLLGDAYDVWDQARGGNDTITSTSSGQYSYAYLEGDAEYLYGRGGNDVLMAHVDGGAQAEMIGDGDYMLSSGEDTLAAVGGDDTLTATGTGHVNLYGDAYETDGHCGNDVLIGGSGDDQLYGDARLMFGDITGGTDTLNGGAGYDRLYGGPGDDRFVFTPGETGDTIWDFNRANSELGITTAEHDLIDLTAFHTSWSAISGSIVPYNDDYDPDLESTIIVMGSDFIVLHNVTSVSEGDFLF